MIARNKKETIVAEVRARFLASPAVFVAENGGLSAAQMTAFRRDIRAGNGRAQVVKNTLAKRAIADGPFATLDEFLSGPLIFGAAVDVAATAKIFAETAKANDKFIIRGGALAEGIRLSAADVGRLAAIPPRPRLLAILLGTMKAPIGGFARTLHEVPARFARTLAALRDQKSGGE
ncbi:MAG: 50S ribosomal protein L10 [Gammaproteobacteria bacterium]